MDDIKLDAYHIDINNYKRKNLLGEGGFGAVFRGTDETTGKDVAIKYIFQTDKLSQKGDQRNVIREVFVPRILNLPGIVQMLGFRFPLTEQEKAKEPVQFIVGSEVGSKKPQIDLTGPVIITELMENGSVEKITKQYIQSKGKGCKNMNPTIRSKIVFGVAATMKKVHSKNVIHRDIKLDNVFLDSNFEPRLADFGLSKVMLGKVDMTMNIGSPFAMAPEIFMDDTYDMSVDVYAYAFLIYRMFTDKIMFADGLPRSPQKYMMKISKGIRPVRPENIPDHYWELVENCWKQNPLDRPTFEDITELLKDDKFAFKEFGMETDLDALHEYQNRIDKEVPIDMNTTTHLPVHRSRVHQTEFNWDRH